MARALAVVGMRRAANSVCYNFLFCVRLDGESWGPAARHPAADDQAIRGLDSGNRNVEISALTRVGLVELVESISAKAARERDGSQGREAKQAAKRERGGFETSPHNSELVVLGARTIAMKPEVRMLASLIDHTLLRPEATESRTILAGWWRFATRGAQA